MQKNDLAKSFFEIIPEIMNIVRSEVYTTIQSDLTFPQFRVLAKINRGINHISTIAQLQGVSQPAISKLINTMEEKGLVLKKTCQIDRRNTEILITAKGKTLFNSTRQMASQNLEKKMKDLSKHNLRQLSDSLRCLSNFANNIQTK